MTRSIALQEETFEKACAAWFRWCKRTGSVGEFPGRLDSHLLVTQKGDYVILANGHRTLAVFALGENNSLTRIEVKGWPGEVESE